MPVKVQVIFYSMYGHIHQMAQAVAEGAAQVSGAEVELLQVEELLSDEVLGKMGAVESRQAFAGLPLASVEHMTQADALIFGTPTRFGMMCAQMRSFFDRTGGLWAQGALIGKVGSVFTSSNTQHGGQESTILSFHTTLLHHGMILVGVPYSQPQLSVAGEMAGGSPYGATTLAAPDGARQPSPGELDLARYQGQRVARIAAALKAGGGVPAAGL
ncbi:MAG: NAD(P)H:quinone oxidoreductase [Desulfarculus sp.]|nr:NAD(P)H:quinone oxidoreductase [Desulfarculus sp.]